jgi:antitoxin VapB
MCASQKSDDSSDRDIAVQSRACLLEESITLNFLRYWDILPKGTDIHEAYVPLFIKDDTVAQLVRRLAELLGISKQDAVKLAVMAELERTAEAVPLRDRFARLRAEHPLPPPTGEVANKNFFDDLSGALP